MTAMTVTWEVGDDVRPDDAESGQLVQRPRCAVPSLSRCVELGRFSRGAGAGEMNGAALW